MNFHKHTDTIFTVENFLSKEDCQEYIELSETNGYDIAKLNTEKGQRVITEGRLSNCFPRNRN